MCCSSAAGWNVHEAVDADVLALLTSAARRGIALGALCTGSYALVRAGLVNGYRCAIHWENLSALREKYPKVNFTEDLFVIDRDRLTCSGGTAPLDLMLNIVGPRIGKNRVSEISEQFIVERIRDAQDQQHIPVIARGGFSRQELVEVVKLMEANIEEPLSLDELAQLVHLSVRQLQRMFRLYLSTTPTHYYLNLRLRRARELLLQTNMSIMNVTVACGFQSPLSFQQVVPHPIRLCAQQRAPQG